MFDLLWFAVTNLIVALVVWTAVFVGVTFLLAIPVTRWCVRLMRRAGALPGGIGAGRRQLLYAWIVVVVFLLPAGIALFNAVPFAVSRGLARLIEDAEPETTKLIVDVIRAHAPTLGIDSALIEALTARGTAAVANDLAIGLHLAAWGHLVTALALVAACFAATILLFRLVLPPVPAVASAITNAP